MKYIITLFILISYSNIAYSQCDQPRYKEKIFDDITEITNVKYGSNINNQGNQQDLFFDVYMANINIDPLEKRPVIFFVHGGSYVGGRKEDSTIKRMCREFASRGYVSISLQYRLEKSESGVEIEPILQFADKNNWYKAIIRSVQDIRGSIRYIKYDVAENNNPYHIDTNNITLYGSSAGAIGVLHATYMDDSDELNINWTGSVNTLGGIEGNTSEHLEYGSINTVRNLILCSGAITDVAWIGNKTDIDVIGFHHNFDYTVPYGHGCFVTAACHLGKFDGMKMYYPYLTNIGARIEQNIIDGLGHPADDLEPELVIEKAVAFMYASQCKYDTTIFVVPTSIKHKTISEIKIYPNPTKSNFIIEIPTTYLDDITMQIYSLNGELIHQNYIEKNQKTYEFNSALNKGMYLIKITDSKMNLSTQKLIIQ